MESRLGCFAAVRAPLKIPIHRIVAVLEEAALRKILLIKKMISKNFRAVIKYIY